MTDGKLSPAMAQARARRILQTGSVQVLDHALQRMTERGMGLIDCENVIRAGQVVQTEFKARSHRYRFETSHMAVVVLFQGEAVLWIVTVWRKD